MTTSHTMSLKSVISREDVALTPAQLGYLNAKAQSDAYERIISLFLSLSKQDGMTKAFLARRLGKKPEQITRWMAAPGNMTLKTYSDLLAAMGHEAVFDAIDLQKSAQQDGFGDDASMLAVAET